MDKDQLDEMDEKADEAIASWSLSAMMVNMLPPPLVQKALGKVVFEISEDLSEIYKVEKNSPLCKDMAGAMVNGLREAYHSKPDVTQSHLDRLKYIPGINIWVGLMMQPNTVPAATRSIGHAFKEYFHAKATNRVIAPADVAKIAANSFSESLTNFGHADAGVFEKHIKRA